MRGCFVAAVLLGALLLVPAARAADEAAPIYEPEAVTVIHLTLSPTAEAELEAEPGEYVEATFEAALSDGTPGGAETPLTSGPKTVGVHLKGSVGGSFRNVDEKPGWKIKFGEIVDNQTFLGLEKLTLNNMVQDPSMAHESLAYRAFAALGVPGPRTGFAYVYLNGDPIGVYLNLEDLDEVALEKRFGEFQKPPQHLYEAEYGDDVTPGDAGEFEVDEGKKSERHDLEALIEAVNEEAGADWSDQVAPYVDLEEMTRMWAVEKYIDHWDGYSGHAEAGLRPNNYYLYSDASGRFQMLPWGTDQTWIPTIGVGTPQREVLFDGAGGVLFNHCLADESCFRLYWEALAELTEVEIPALDPAAAVAATAALLEPWQEDELNQGRPEHSAGEIEAGLEESLDFIAGREEEALGWLAANEPEPVEEAAQEESNPPAQKPVPPAPPAATPSEPPRIAAVVKRPGQLRLRIQLSSAGRLQEWVSVHQGGRRRRVCAVFASSAAAETVALRCPYPRFLRQRLRRRPVWVRVVTQLTAADGTVETTVRRVRLPRH